MTSVGFGNIAAETDNEKIFSIGMMIVAGKKMKMQCFDIRFISIELHIIYNCLYDVLSHTS